MVGAQQAGQLLGQLSAGEPRQLQPHHPPVADQLSQPDSPLSVTRRLIAEFAARPTAKPPAELAEREREILRLVSAGLSTADIARRPVISPLTAKTHCHDRA